jgi:hypothetical protein
MERHLKVVMSHESLPLTAGLDIVVIRATSCAQYVTLQVKIDEAKLEHAGLAQQTSFDPALLHSLLRLVKPTQNLSACQRRV